MKNFFRIFLIIGLMAYATMSANAIEAEFDYNIEEVIETLYLYYPIYGFEDKLLIRHFDRYQYKTSLWTHDAGGALEKKFEIPSNDSNGSLSAFIRFNGWVYFSGPNGNGGYDWWKWDEINPPVQVSTINYKYSIITPVLFQGKLYYSATTELDGQEFWRFDGINNPEFFGDTIPGTGISGSTHRIVFKDKLVYSNWDPVYGFELFQYDGVNPPTMVMDIKPGYGYSNAQYFTEWNGRLYFNAYSSTGLGIWEYDGINPPVEIEGSNVYPGKLVVFDNRIIFKGYDDQHGAELWEYDGVNPPRLLYDIYPRVGPYSSAPTNFQVVKNNLFFSANEGSSYYDDGVGTELWVYDGVRPPRLVKDICPGPQTSSVPYSSNPELYNGGDRLYITGDYCISNKLLMFDGVLAASVETGIPSEISMSSATCSGTVLSNGGGNVIERGICWSTSTLPTVADNNVSSGSGLGQFSASITGLAPNTTYYVRAYAVNSAGTVYGNEESFITPGNFISIVTPNGGEQWNNTTVSNITWEASGISNPLVISLVKDGQVLGTIANGISPDTTSYAWITGLYSEGMAEPGTGYTIKIEESGTGVSDQSDDVFNLVGNAGSTVLFVDSTGNGIAGGVVMYYDSGWKTAGTTDSNGKLVLDLATLKSYTFRMNYSGASLDKRQDISVNSTVVFRTSQVSVQLKNSLGNPMDTGTVLYYAGGWKTLGNTVSGVTQKELLPLSYTFRMSYGGASLDKKQDISVEPVVVFQTVNANVQLKDSLGNPMDTGGVSYYASGWKTFGNTASGVTQKELLPLSYTFRMSYSGASLDKKQDISAEPVVVFQTVNVTVQLKTSNGNPLDTGAVMYYASGWKTLGNTVSGEAKKELLPLSYTFRMSYGGASLDLKQNVLSAPLVTYQTGKVVSTSGSCTNYYASGWKAFTSGMELLPVTYTFRFNDGTPDTKNAVEAGTTTSIH
jgi:ELWxxDGT repeat protein